MNFWIISDSHFGHNKLKQFGRPEHFEIRILNGLSKISSEDILIHLGDICIGDDAAWHQQLKKIFCHKWLVLGNHDGKSMSWYLSHGWSSVNTYFAFNIFGKHILFSHIPKIDIGYDLNIHGHLHDNQHRANDPEILAVKNNKQILVAIEQNNYQPYNLKTLIENYKP
jgi:calcineurin-like phosphoesterase family protein